MYNLCMPFMSKLSEVPKKDFEKGNDILVLEIKHALLT